MTFGGRWVQVLLGLVGSVVSARALGPSELGRFGLIISIIMVFGTLADAGLTYSAIRLIARGAEQDVYRAKAVARSYFFLRVLTGVSVALLGIPLSWPLAWALGYPELVPYLQLAFLTLFSLSLSSYPGTILVGLSKFKEFGVAGVLGMLLGSGAVALATRTFRWEGFASVEDLVNHMAGGVLMGFGGVTALGCTIGQGLSGVSTLALGSILALAGIVAGCVAALKYQYWRIEVD